VRADLALVGFGNVGKRFAALLDERRDWLLRECDLDCRIVGIATRRHGSLQERRGISVERALEETGRLQPAGAEPTPSALAIIEALGQSDAALRILVETTTLDISAGRPAIDYIHAAIDAGCHAVTANKGPAAFAFRSLTDRARAAGVWFLFEGAVMDGVPIFNLVRETLPAVNILEFRGVVNATTNHILTALEEGEEFSAALECMQKAGIAEADPSLDVDGWDAAAKGAALANALMDARITPHDVERRGIGAASAAIARGALTRGLRLRLVTTGTRDAGGSVRVSVAPQELPAADLLAGLRGMANALVLRTDLLGDIAIHQLGGSLTQTAYALLSDIITIRKRAGSPARA
jgi:homoserine dehydrogenase